MQLKHRPRISKHAYDRAAERMGLQHLGFYAWVDATWKNWYPINAQTLQEAGLICSPEDAYFYAIPWSFTENVAICLSADKMIRTVMIYDANNEVKQEHKPILDDPLFACVKRAVNEKLVEPKSILNKLIGCNFNEGHPPTKAALAAYGNGAISLDAFLMIMKSKEKYRENMLAGCLRNKA